jgi:exodeoxyribonuclease V alpha subunit
MRHDASAMLVPGGTAQARLRAAAGYPQDLLDLVQETDLDESSVFLAWQLGEMATALAPPERADFVFLCARLLAAEAAGSTRLAISGKDRALLARTPDLAGGPDARTPLVVEHDCLYTRRSHACESRIVAALAARLDKLGPFSAQAIERALADTVRSTSPTPSREQSAAVAAALARLVGIISGGPGTGKTTTALVLVRCLARLGVPPSGIALCAPTGKAASRMEDDIRRRLAALANPDLIDAALLRGCPKAQTVHRLLGITGDPASLFRPADQPLPFRAVIVDESSMVDTVLMDRLLGAVPAGVPLVLIGDADQLPSVSAGSVFRDLGAYSTHLVHGFRTGSSGTAGQRLSSLAAAVRAGQTGAMADLCDFRAEPGQLRHAGIEHLPREKRAELLRAYHQRAFADPEAARLAKHVFVLNEVGFDADDAARLDGLAMRAARCRILAVTRERATGSMQTNAFLHELGGGGPAFLPGEPVLMLRNDYARELWNGDQGVAVWVRRPGRSPSVAVAFRGRAGWQAVDPGSMGRALGHAYALTVHKSQGSEFDEVLLLLPDFACPIFTRELLYTAVSRARRSVVLCGPVDMLDLAIATKEARDSGVAARLAALVPPLT